MADVIASLRVARDHQLLVSIRGGGHGIAGFALSDGGLMIDLSRIKSVRVDLAGQTARAEGGATWGDFDHETQALGLERVMNHNMLWLAASMRRCHLRSIVLRNYKMWIVHNTL